MLVTMLHVDAKNILFWRISGRKPLNELEIKRKMLSSYLDSQKRMEQYIKELKNSVANDSNMKCENHLEYKCLLWKEIVGEFEKCLEERDRIKNLIATIKNPKYEHVLISRYIHGLNVKEISKLVGKHERSIKRIMRAAIECMDVKCLDEPA